MSFWDTLPRPFFVQAPMEDVTDAAFRRLIARYGKPHVFFTEFTSADGLALADEAGQRAIRKRLIFSSEERPIVAQLFSATPERMERAARIVEELGFDGIDINMGCPDRSVEKSGCGASLIKNPALAKELVRAGKRGAPSLPVSVKTRIGYAVNQLPEWVPILLGEGIAALTIHARTRNELSEVPARWGHIAETVAIRDSLGASTLIFGIGDVLDLEDARAKVADTGCDGVMIGRAIYCNPWLYADRKTPPAPDEKIGALLEHLALFDELLAAVVHFAVMKKHFKAYISGWEHASALRARLMETESVAEARRVLSLALHADRG